MPPRYAYWTIILEGKPTAFRARTPEELLPTLKQLQLRHPDTSMRWFARGRLWVSPDEERAAAQARRQNRERRGPAWRPGGEHRDPRDRFKVPRDEARRRFAAKLRRDRDEEKGAPRTGRSGGRERPGGPGASERPRGRGPGEPGGPGGRERPGGPGRQRDREQGSRRPGAGGRPGGTGGQAGREGQRGRGRGGGRGGGKGEGGKGRGNGGRGGPGGGGRGGR